MQLRAASTDVRSLARAAAPRAAAALALGAIVAAAAALRFADLATNPGGLYPDEAAEGLDAQRLLHVAGFHPVFFHDDGGREALFGYLVAGVFRFAGETVLALRATSAGVGVAAVLAVWLFARRFGTWAGLAAAGWAAGSLWLVCVSRDGMRDMLVPLLGALALAALLAWSDRPSRRTAVLAGAVTSLAALYTYQPLKLLPVLVLAWLLWVRRVDLERFERLRPGIRPFAAAFVLVALPMLGAALADPSNYLGRAVSVTPLNPGVQADGGPIEHVARTLGMFALTGDPNARHDVAEIPLLGWPLSLVALLGATRLWRHRRDAAHALVLWSLPLFLVPPLVAVEGSSPHFLRALGLAAPLGATIGLGCRELVERARAGWGARGALPAAAAAAAVLAVTAAGSGAAYLSRQPAARYEPYMFELTAIAARATATPHAAVILDDYRATVVRFLDYHDPPAIVAPGARLADAGAYSEIIARDRGDLTAAVGAALAARAVPLARDPGGNVTAWTVAP